MLFLNDTISLQNSKIVSKIFSQHAREGITSYLNLFGDLYYGHLHPTIFLERHKGLMEEFTQRLLNNGPDIAHNLCMLELAQREQWRWPAPLTETPTGLLWSAGNSRTVATGLVHTDPWSKLPVLLLQNCGSNPDKYLYDGIKITTDQELHSVLGVEYKDDGDYHPPELELQATLTEGPALLLKYVGNKQSEQDYWAIGESKLQQFKAWRRRYGHEPTLKVYTDYPWQIVNTAWIIEHMGPIPNKDTIYKPGHLERVINGLKDTHEHALYVVNNRRINVDNLLPWMDTEHTLYIDKNWDFALQRSDTDSKNKFISIGQDYAK